MRRWPGLNEEESESGEEDPREAYKKRVPDPRMVLIPAVSKRAAPKVIRFPLQELTRKREDKNLPHCVILLLFQYVTLRHFGVACFSFGGFLAGIGRAVELDKL